MGELSPILQATLFIVNGLAVLLTVALPYWKMKQIECKVDYAIGLLRSGYCELTGVDLGWFIEQKMKYNRLRPYMHGDKRY